MHIIIIITIITIITNINDNIIIINIIIIIIIMIIIIIAIIMMIIMIIIHGVLSAKLGVITRPDPCMPRIQCSAEVSSSPARGATKGERTKGYLYVT